jgi:hypothetical protein
VRHGAVVAEPLKRLHRDRLVLAAGAEGEVIEVVANVDVRWRCSLAPYADLGHAVGDQAVEASTASRRERASDLPPLKLLERVATLAAAYAAKAAGLAASDRPDAVGDEIRWQLDHMSPAVKAALRLLPPIGENSSRPLGPGLLASGLLGTIIRDLQTGLTVD